MNLEQIATELTEMGVTDFWASMLRYLANEAGYSGEHDVKFEKLSDSVAVTFGECQGEMDAQRVVIEALNQYLSINTYTDGAVFLVPVTVTTLKKPTQQMKTREGSATEGKDMTAEEIGKVLFDSGVNPLACEETVRILIRKGFSRIIPNVSIARVKDKVDFIFGDYVVATNIEPTEKGEMLGFAYSIWLPLLRAGCFSYDIANQKETETYIPKTTIQILKPVYRDRLEKAGLSEEAIRVILDEVFHGKALKAPKEDSSFVILSGKDVLHIYYSHNNKAIGMANIEATKSTHAGDVIDYSVGIEDATFIVDTSNTQEKMIHRHVGVPKLTLNLSNGNSYELPFKKTYHAVSDEVVAFEIECNAVINLSDKVLNNPIGPALMDLNEIQKDQYFIHGTEYTQDDFINRISSPDRS